MKILGLIVIITGSLMAHANECHRETHPEERALSIEYLMLATAGQQVCQVPEGKCWSIGHHRLDKFNGDCSKAFEFYKNRTDRFECYQSTEGVSELLLFGTREVVEFKLCYLCEPEKGSEK